jgi:prepilin-type N-terminal cleavage/methylation domain-containing protein
MKVKSRQSGLTLMEMTVVVAVVALLAVFGLPAVRTLLNSFESQAGAKCMISAALASARAIAAKEQHYAGVRFQHKYQQDNKGCQYMIFIIHDADPAPDGTDYANGFRAVEGINPMKLPDNVGVMDLRIGSDEINLNEEIDENKELTDTTTFSIVFSPSGKLVIHPVRVWNRNGKKSDASRDDVFNTKTNVEDKKIAMFYQDDYADLGLEQEASRNSFIIYDKTEFDKVDEGGRYDDYLMHLEVIYINPYTGRMIER